MIDFQSFSGREFLLQPTEGIEGSHSTDGPDGTGGTEGTDDTEDTGENSLIIPFNILSIGQ